jgi:hypothetical protein
VIAVPARVAAAERERLVQQGPLCNSTTTSPVMLGVNSRMLGLCQRVARLGTPPRLLAQREWSPPSTLRCHPLLPNLPRRPPDSALPPSCCRLTRSFDAVESSEPHAPSDARATRRGGCLHVTTRPNRSEHVQVSTELGARDGCHEAIVEQCRHVVPGGAVVLRVAEVARVRDHDG